MMVMTVMTMMAMMTKTNIMIMWIIFKMVQNSDYDSHLQHEEKTTAVQYSFGRKA